MLDEPQWKGQVRGRGLSGPPPSPARIYLMDPPPGSWVPPLLLPQHTSEMGARPVHGDYRKTPHWFTKDLKSYWKCQEHLRRETSV